jgi:phage shock protein PspC (stress-responsive transcriptional regulator)
LKNCTNLNFRNPSLSLPDGRQAGPLTKGGIKGGSGGLGSYFLSNSKGISVLFLIIAMLLMVTIGYVLSYLIPTKQKSIKFPIYSTQAFYIAQSGAEYAIRYSSEQGWRGATDSGTYDLTRLNGVGVNQRNLGNGRFTINYTAATNTLTSTGVVTNSSESRIITVSNFTPFLRLVFDSASEAPCWCLVTRRVRFYIRNVRSTSVTLSSFSAIWTTGTARTLTRIFMNGTSRYNSNYTNGNPAVNLSSTQTITSGQLITILIYWSGNLTTPANINITFYTGALGTGDSYKFNLDPSVNNLPNCAVGC